MAKQLDAMKQALDKMTEKHEQVQQDLKKQIEQLKNSGQIADAQRLQKQLDQLQQQSPQMDQLKQMANKLGQARKCNEIGKAGRSRQGLAANGQANPIAQAASRRTTNARSIAR